MQFPSGRSLVPPRKRGAGASAKSGHSLKTPWLFILLCMSPWLIGFIGFTIYPMGSSLYMSFTKWDMINEPEWIGIDNYTRMFTEDTEFYQALYNTMWISAVSIPLRIGFAMFTAWLLTKARHGRSVYRTIFFIPSMVPTVAATMVFAYIFNPVFGPLNGFLMKLGIEEPPMWFNDPAYTKWGLIILGLWGIGDTTIIFLAGLLDIPKSLYEAASLEGANAWQQFRYVTFPLMTPVVFFSGVTGVIGSFQYFTQAFVAVPPLYDFAHSAYFYATHVYMVAFQWYEMGYASALAWVLLVITLFFTLIILRTQKRWVHYPNGSLFK